MMFNMYLFLKKNRLRKKLHLYKIAFDLLFDWLSLFYTILIVGYILAAIMMEGGFSTWSNQTAIFFDGIAMDRIWSIMTIIPLAMLFRSFRYPGVMFSTAEYTLKILPHKVGKIWFFVALERWIKALFIYCILGTILFLFSPTSLSIICLYVFLLFLINVVMTPIEWKFFQLHIIKKIGIFILFVSFTIVSVIVNSPMIGMSLLVLCIAIHLFIYRNLFEKTDWKRVTAACDYKLWNMVIIGRASRTSFKKDRQYSIWQRLSIWKKPFIYQDTAVYHRLWFIYFEKNIVVILQFFGAMLLLLFVFMFVKELLFFIGLAFVVHAYTTVAATMYSDRLTTGVVQVLPWDVQAYKRTFIKWVGFSGIILLFPYMVYTILHFSYWLLALLPIIVIAFYLLLYTKLDKVIHRWNKAYTYVAWADMVGYGLLVIVGLSLLFPTLILIGCMVAFCTLMYMKKLQL